MASFSIRRGEIGDLAEITAVFRAASLSNAGDREHLLAHPEVLVFPDASLRAGFTTVATEAGRIVGFATAVPEGGVWELEDLFVEPSRMRHGVGTALMREMLSRIRAEGGDRIDVTANPHADAFYRHMGFVDAGSAVTDFGTAPRMTLRVSTA
jgi:GNAT superfamily N-acetyltransferase